MTPRPSVAVVEDEPGLADLLCWSLEDAGFSAKSYASAGRFITDLRRRLPDAVLLDMRLPDMSGRDVLRVLRADPATSALVVIAMSAAEVDAASAVKGFDCGADDYLRKPLEMELLAVRLKSLLARRDAAPKPAVIDAGGLQVLLDERRCVSDGAEVTLTRLEFDLLVHFLRNARHVLTRRMLVDAVWPEAPPSGSRSVDKHVETLRRKIGRHGKRITTSVRLGYVFEG